MLIKEDNEIDDTDETVVNKLSRDNIEATDAILKEVEVHVMNETVTGLDADEADSDDIDIWTLLTGKLEDSWTIVIEDDTDDILEDKIEPCTLLAVDIDALPTVIRDDSADSDANDSELDKTLVVYWTDAN